MQEKIIEQKYKEGEIKCWVYGLSKGQPVNGGYLEVTDTEIKDVLKEIEVVLRIEGVAFMGGRVYYFDTDIDEVRVYRCNVLNDIIVGIEEIPENEANLDIQVERGLISGVLMQFKEMVRTQTNKVGSNSYVVGEKVAISEQGKEAEVCIERLEAVAKTLLREHGGKGILPTFFGVYETEEAKVVVVYKVLNDIYGLAEHVKEQLDKNKRMLAWVYMVHVGDQENRRYLCGWGDVTKGLSGVRVYKWQEGNIEEIPPDDFAMGCVWVLKGVIELLIKQRKKS